jgi:transcriptional regulator with XRE-family HTH domain
VNVKTHSFTIIASGFDASTDFADRFFEAGCDDATIGIQKGLVVLEFDREARTFIGAIVTALRDVYSTGAKIERVEPDYLVSASEIAKRSGCSRSAVSLYAKGERGNDFPKPVARVTTDSPLWDWVKVSAWLHRECGLPLEAVVEARTLRELNKVVVEHAKATSRLGRRIEKEAEREPIAA